MPRRLIALLAVLLVLVNSAAFADPVVIAQVPTDTPAQINLAPADQSGDQAQQPGAPTQTRTPTPQGVALLEAKDFANVRAEPSTDAAQLGQIHKGDTYNVIGRYVSWIQFEFQASPTGRGWVFGDLVDLSGNVDNIPNIDPYGQQSAQDNAVAGATATQAILTQTPGGVLTATVLARINAPLGTAAPTDSGTHVIEPTFTYPPGIVPIPPTAGAAVSTDAPNIQPLTPATNGSSLPPIVPIIILGGLGLLGLAASALRRG